MAKFNAIEFEQNGIKGYLINFKYSQLMDNLIVDTWNPRNPLGYQRPHKEAKSKKFMEYMMGEHSICPVPIVVNIREDEGSKFSFDKKTNQLSISDKNTHNKKTNYWVPEGQHRLYGFKKIYEEEGKDLDIPAVIMNVPHYMEIWHFIKINQEQTKVQRDRAEEAIISFQDKLPDNQNMNIGNLKKEKEIAIHITNKLNEISGSPFQGRIQKTGNEIRSVVKATSFFVAIEDVVKKVKTEPKFEAENSIKFIDNVANWLKSYWRAINTVIPEAFDEERNYLVLKTAGIFSLNRLAAATIDRMSAVTKNTSQSSISEQSYTQVFRRPEMQEYMCADFWSTNNDLEGAKSYGSSQQSYARILERLETSMKSAIDNI